METLAIYELSSGKFTAQNDLDQKYQSKHLVISNETEFTNLSVFAEIRSTNK